MISFPSFLVSPDAGYPATLAHSGLSTSHQAAGRSRLSPHLPDEGYLTVRPTMDAGSSL